MNQELPNSSGGGTRTRRNIVKMGVILASAGIATVEHAWGFDADEIRMIVKMPSHRQLDEWDRRPPAKALFLGGEIIDATPVRLDIVAHQRAVVLESVFEKKPDCGLTIVPARGAVAKGPHAEHTIERL
jgi:hypothetical protein